MQKTNAQHIVNFAVSTGLKEWFCANQLHFVRYVYKQERVNSSFFFTEHHYRVPTKKGNCAIEIGGKKDFHERCQCYENDISVCKNYCSKDSGCKGYVKVAFNCDLATTSNCAEGCFKYNPGNVGELLVDEDYYATINPSYEGCYIKTFG